MCDFGVQKGQSPFEGYDPRDHGGAVIGGQSTKRAAEFFAGRPFRDGKGRRQHLPLGEGGSLARPAGVTVYDLRE